MKSCVVRIAFIGLLGMSVLASACGSSSEDERTSDDTTAAPLPPGQLVFPLMLSYRRWDYHLAQYLDEHPQFEMVELFVDDINSDEPKVWVFFTDAAPPKHQYHYVNDDSLAEYLTGGADKGLNRDVFVVPMDFNFTEEEDGAPSFEVSFVEDDEQPVSWVFNTIGPPEAQYGAGLVEQSGHDLIGGILVMYVPESNLASEDTVLQIGEDRYPVLEWEEYSEPPYFTAYHGFCSRNIAHGYLAAFDTTYETLSVPDEVVPGAAWQTTYQVEDGEPVSFDWEVTEVSDHTFTAKVDANVLTETLDTEGAHLNELRFEAEDGFIAVQFDPALPDLQRMPDGGIAESVFTVEVDDYIDQITGTVSVSRDKSSTELLFAPASPDWAVGNQMRVTVDFTDSGHAVHIETIQL